jgi:hypothetical protein
MGHNKALPASGHQVEWRTGDQQPASSVVMRWENEGWTAEVALHRDDAVAVFRLSAQWQVQQMLLFRDMTEPDLWLATDGRGRWGEMNGAHRTELDGCVDIDFMGTPFTNSAIIHRLPLHVGDQTDIHVITIDVETLAVLNEPQRYHRVDEFVWQYHSLQTGQPVTVTVDEFGFVIDEPHSFIRVTQSH